MKPDYLSQPDLPASCIYFAIFNKGSFVAGFEEYADCVAALTEGENGVAYRVNVARGEHGEIVHELMESVPVVFD